MPAGYRSPSVPDEALPTLPLQPANGRPTPDDKIIQEILATAANGNADELAQYFRRSGPYDPLSIIDSATGDSTLHRAAAAGNLQAMSAIQSSFGPNMGHQVGQERRYWLFLTHQNYAGETALHAAARAGNLVGAKGVYRIFHQMEATDDEERGPEADEPSAEFWSTADFSDNPFFLVPALVFVGTKNKAGRDAATEARESGHEQVARWLQELEQRLDPLGKGKDDEFMRQSRLEVLRRHQYTDDAE
jgi:ankyrin repeat protein